MVSRNGFAAIAACAALACAGLVRASDAGSPADALTLTQPVYAADAPRKPLMNLLDQAGVAGTLDEYRINIGGFVEGSWTYNFNTQPGGLNPGRVFDIEDQDPTLNQVDVFAERTVAISPDKFDLGGRMEWMWGGDARFIHANGLFDYDGFSDGPDNQIDLVQAYVQANLPVGNGLLLTAGKFVTLLGAETINPTSNPLYSHSFLFNFAIPFTHTGVMGKYAIDQNWSVSAGMFRGWDQATEDNNDAVTWHGQVAYVSEKLDFYVNLITGPEQPDNDSNYRTLVDATFVYRDSDKLSFTINGDYGWEPEAGRDGTDAIWWGAAGYVTYKVCDYATLQGRAEYFSDHDGARGTGIELTEVTVGVNLKPMPNDAYGSALMIRPELRWDYASDPVFDGGNDHGQYTFGIDAIYAF